ncbi:MAG: carboxyl-terminal processing protease [Planctomycetota bacterium]|jgi:carboxyl-terminal processing protease
MTQQRIFPTLAALGLLPLAFLASQVATAAPADPGFPADPAPAVQEGNDEIEALVREEASKAADLELDALWTRALELRGLEQLGGAEALDRALESLLSQPDKLAPRTALFVASARLQGYRPQPIPLANALVPLLETHDGTIAAAATALLGDPIFRGLTRSRTDLGELLLTRAQDASREASERLRYARTLHAIGGAKEGLDARTEIASFLDSQDPERRAQGALALAGLRGEVIEGRLRDELERFSRVPTAAGALASEILKRSRQREFLDRQIRDQQEKYESGRLSAELQEFVDVMGMIEGRHLEGNLVERADLVEAAMAGMLRYMDQHSSYLSSEAYGSFFQDLEAEYGGIGAYVDIDPDDGLFTIQRPIYSGPAYRAGVKTNDKIVRIDNWPTLGQDREEIIKRLKGQPGTTISLYIWQRGMDTDLIDRPTEDMLVEINRGLIEIPAGSWQMLPGKVGLIELTTFSRVAMEEIEGWLGELQEAGMRALVFDLRRNSGGLLTEAREVAELFLPKGSLVVSTEGRGDEPRPLRTRRDPVLSPEIPIIVLTGRFTASAAEIVAGALQDHERATLVGDRTYGKGSVQQLMPVEGAEEDQWKDQNKNGYWDTWEPIVVDRDEDGVVDYAPRVKLTIARYLLPSGRSIHRLLNREGEVIQEGGIVPDEAVSLGTIERWRFVERRRIAREEVLETYVREQYAVHAELFQRLAVNDLRDPNLYPDFDALVTALDTTLSRDDVRSVLRDLVRREVQDDFGAEFPFADFVEDVQVQRALEVVFESLSEDPRSVADYGPVFDFADAQDPTLDIATLDLRNNRLGRARDMVEEWRQAIGGTDLISESELNELLGILEGEIQDK